MIKNSRYTNPFIYFEGLKIGDVVSMFMYAVVTIVVVLTLFSDNRDVKQLHVFFYAFLSQMFLYFFLYTSLRNFTSYLIWFGFGVIHLVLFFVFRSDPTLVMPMGNAANGLAGTIVLLLLFQLLRYVSLKIQLREFVAPSKGGNYDLFENRRVVFADYLMFVIYMAAFGGLFYLSTLYQAVYRKHLLSHVLLVLFL